MKPMRVYAQIDLEAVCSNVRESMKRVGKGVKAMAVVKTDAYGHGAVSVAQALSGIGVYAFAVATAEEGVELRLSGIEKPILVLGHVFPDELKRALTHDISLTVYSYDTAKEISRMAQTLNVTAKIHIAIDTGMGRIGFQPNQDSLEDIGGISRLPNLSMEGVFTHFANADAADKTSMNHQIELFEDFTAKMEEAGIHCKLRHMCNSAAVMDRDHDFLDMVRLGITVYGLEPSNEVQKENLALKPAMSMISHVSHVKEVGAGFTVSYGSTYTTTGPTVIATVPVGYGDGYPRSLSNKGTVLIHGQRVPIIGRICMDQFMVDVTSLEDVSVGDEVVLFGTQDGATISVEELAEQSGRFNYEFVCDINKRVPRVDKY